MSREVRVELCPDGPVLVRGADQVRDGDGALHPVTRPVVAVCTCGRTGRAPWCDSTHRFLRRNDGAGDPAQRGADRPSSTPSS